MRNHLQRSNTRRHSRIRASVVRPDREPGRRLGRTPRMLRFGSRRWAHSVPKRQSGHEALAHLLSCFLMCDRKHADPSRAAGGVRPRGPRRAFAWTLLLGAVLLGIVAMHTLGHMVDHDRGAVATSHGRTMAVHHVNSPTPAAQETSPGAMHSSAFHDVAQATAPGAGMVSDPSVVCLAVLVAAGLFIALRRSAWRLQSSPHDQPSRLRPACLPDPRGPPGLGLSLTRLAVLRI
ncbi:DUF6153 family protein [Spirillospora sp. NPDC047418]